MLETLSSLVIAFQLAASLHTVVLISQLHCMKKALSTSASSAQSSTSTPALSTQLSAKRPSAPPTEDASHTDRPLLYSANEDSTADRRHRVPLTGLPRTLTDFLSFETFS
eukprot:c39944_g1_i1 orf=3-329(-)